MNVTILAERQAKALERIRAIAPALAEQANVPEDMLERMTASSKDRDVEAMQRMEAVADLLEHVVHNLPVETLLEVKETVLLNLPAKEVIQSLTTIEDIDQLQLLLEDEQAGKARKSVITALEARVAELTTPSGQAGTEPGALEDETKTAEENDGPKEEC